MFITHEEGMEVSVNKLQGKGEGNLKKRKSDLKSFCKNSLCKDGVDLCLG